MKMWFGVLPKALTSSCEGDLGVSSTMRGCWRTFFIRSDIEIHFASETMQRNRSRSSKVYEMMLSKLLGASNMISDPIFDGKCCVHAVQASFLAQLSVCTPKPHQHSSPRNKHQPCYFQTQTCSQTRIHRCKACLEHLNSSANQQFTRYKELTIMLSNVCLDGELVFF